MSEPASPVSSTTEFYRPVEVVFVRPPRRRTWLYVLFFLLTVLTTLVMGARMAFNFENNLAPFADGPLSLFPIFWALGEPTHLWLGVPFAFTLMTILFAHEMGHYLYCRYYRVHATLPLFLPFPSLIGTMGAFIRIKSPIRSRSALFDIGIAGPIAGFVLALGALFVGLRLSKPLAAPALADIQIGYPIIFGLVNRLLHGSASPALETMNLHPVAMAAWVGMFATALNLLPGGQLDGGHIIYSILPRWHRPISIATMLILIPLAYYHWRGWLIWALMVGFTGLRHPMIPAYPGITQGRRWMALLALLMLSLTFTFNPITLHGGL
jgi:membrane-associated protease RseP (regulator of RpoE activity)